MPGIELTEAEQSAIIAIALLVLVCLVLILGICWLSTDLLKTLIHAVTGT